MSLLALLGWGALAGCSTFADHIADDRAAHRSFERARAQAKTFAPELTEELDAVGASRDHNRATVQLAACADRYTSALRWRRQAEHGDAFDGDALRREANGTTPRRDAARWQVRRLDAPETAWGHFAESCALVCASVMAPANDANARDAALARAVLARCEEETVAARVAVAEADRRREAEEAHALLGRAEEHAGAGRALEAVRAFEAAEEAAERLTHDHALRARLAATREALGEPIARVGAFRAAPAVRSARHRRAAIASELDAIARALARLDRQLVASGERTTYAADGGLTGHEGGDPVAHQRQLDEQRALWRQQQRLEAERAELEATLVRAAQEHGLM